ncbi:hypothetical protein QYE76_044242 [Lolium multiflorum]|uniref:Uncharacterized protein n=1 Tax=Lolium multiflorum TaxID=4521 RepID=A0AAD8TIF3_LOLMU|nr:hypothetical protein QYE76_044242 [Lolium multiflorum]
MDGGRGGGDAPAATLEAATGARGGGRCAGCYVGSSAGAWTGRRPMRRLLRWKQRQGPGRGGGRCAGCYVGSSDGGLDGAAADAPTMGISFFSIAGGFLRGFSSVVEKMMGQERRLQ